MKLLLMKKIGRHVAVILISGLFVSLVPSSAGAEVVVKTDKGRYKLGDTITVSITNNLNEPVYFEGLCSINNCEQFQGEWRCEQLECDAPEEILSSDQTKEYRIKVLGLLAGNMRYKLDYRTAILEKSRSTYSNDFFVANPRKGGLFKGKPPAKTAKKSSLTKSSPASEAAAKPLNPKIIDISKTGKWTNNRYIAEKFKNQNRPSNQELIRQRKQQDRNARKLDRRAAMGDEIVLTVSGVDDSEREALGQLLAQGYNSVNAVEEVYYSSGNVQYYVELNVDTRSFSEEIEKVNLAVFRLDVIRITAGRIDCVLRSL